MSALDSELHNPRESKQEDVACCPRCCNPMSDDEYSDMTNWIPPIGFYPAFPCKIDEPMCDECKRKADGEFILPLRSLTQEQWICVLNIILEENGYNPIEEKK